MTGRFWVKVDQGLEGGCWQWTASTDRWGYGQFRHRGTMCRAHRIAYELIVGPIPDGMTLDHLCRNRRCVNPHHLEPVTLAENVRRGDNAQRHKTQCPHGHAYTAENTGRDPYGWRFCRTCRRIREKGRVRHRRRGGRADGAGQGAKAGKEMRAA